MQPHEVQAMAISNEKAIAALDARIDGITQRVLSLEKDELNFGRRADCSGKVCVGI